MPTSAFDEEIRILEKWKKRDPRVHRRYAEWRRKWKVRGPVAFAHDLLKIDPETGKPLKISDDQKEWLLDVSKRGVRLTIITAGRGAGKTFVLAVYVIWRIFTHEYWGISCMGGSAEQSAKIHKYVSYWVRECPSLKEYCAKCTTKKVMSYANGEALFLSCSATSVRGPHTHELIIDEQAAGESRGKTKEIKAAIFQVSTSPDLHITKSSTAQYIHGDFLNTWNNYKRLGYKRYKWAIAKHNSGVTDPYQIYQESDMRNWSSNVPWIPDLNIKILRNARSNDEWLVEALGGISRASGLVFNPVDIDSCICSRCRDNGKPCKPYEDGYCPIVQYYMQLEGKPTNKIPHSVTEALRKVGQRVEGVDWGKSAPCAYTTTGKFKRVAFVLHSEEETGASDDAKIQKAADIAKKWHIEIIRPDPREWAYNNALSAKGFAVHQLFSGDRGDIAKGKMVFTVKKFVERHLLIIPCVFEDLIRSMRNASYDETGKVRKADDHSFDSLLYAVSLYGEMASHDAFWEAMRGEVKEVIDEEKKAKEEAQKQENIKRTGDKDVQIIDDWEKFIQEKKWEKEELEEDEEFPWGEGVDMWGEKD